MAKAKAAPKEKAAPKAKAKKVDAGLCPNCSTAVKGVLERATESNASDSVVYTISGADYKMLEELVG
jgi:hypothetical protein